MSTPVTSQPASTGRAYLFLAITAMCWGANAIFGKLAVDEASPMAVVVFRWLLVVQKQPVLLGSIKFSCWKGV